MSSNVEQASPAPEIPAPQTPSPATPTPATPSPASSRQAISYCPYCAEETLFPLEGGGWDCRSCQRAFSVKFLGLVAA